MPLISLTNGETAYRWHGSKTGDIIVLVHGLTTPSFVWGPLLPILTAAGYRVLTYDLYGRGDSDAPFGKQTPDFFTQQLTELLDALDVSEPVHLVGYSMGGGIVSWAADNAPKRFHSVTLIAPIGFRTSLGWAETLAKLPVLGDVLMQMLGPRKFRQGVEAEAALDGSPEWITVAQQAETRKAGFIRSVLSSMRHMIHLDLTPLHQRLGLPICAVWAKDDTIIPIDGAASLSAVNGTVDTHVVMGARHGLAYTHPEEVGTAITSFLSCLNNDLA